MRVRWRQFCEVEKGVKKRKRFWSSRISTAHKRKGPPASRFFWLLLTAVVRIFPSYHIWRRNKATQLRENSSLVDTPSGPIEYQVVGQGPAVIYAHGTPGGYDQGIAFSKFLDAKSCTIISPSRPGYLRTPRSSGISPEEQADLYAALLDALGIKKAVIIGFSGGGPSALSFASRYPERCRGLIMIGAIVQRYSYIENLQLLPLHKRMISRLIEYLMTCEPFLYCILPIARLIPSGDAVAGMLSSGTTYRLRKEGYINDSITFSHIQDLQQKEVTVPTLVIHGTQDEDVPFEDALLLSRTIPDVTLLALEKGDHTSFYTRARVVMPMIRHFIAHLSI